MEHINVQSVYQFQRHQFSLVVGFVFFSLVSYSFHSMNMRLPQTKSHHCVVSNVYFSQSILLMCRHTTTTTKNVENVLFISIDGLNSTTSRTEMISLELYLISTQAMIACLVNDAVDCG